MQGNRHKLKDLNKTNKANGRGRQEQEILEGIVQGNKSSDLFLRDVLSDPPLFPPLSRLFLL
jgi:hypothetical protein